MCNQPRGALRIPNPHSVDRAAAHRCACPDVELIQSIVTRCEIVQTVWSLLVVVQLALDQSRTSKQPHAQSRAEQVRQTAIREAREPPSRACMRVRCALHSPCVPVCSDAAMMGLVCLCSSAEAAAASGTSAHDDDAEEAAEAPDDEDADGEAGPPALTLRYMAAAQRKGHSQRVKRPLSTEPTRSGTAVPIGAPSFLPDPPLCSV